METPLLIDLGLLVSGMLAAGTSYLNRGGMGSATENISTPQEGALSIKLSQKWKPYQYISPFIDHLGYSIGGTMIIGGGIGVLADMVSEVSNLFNIPLSTDATLPIFTYGVGATAVIAYSIYDFFSREFKKNENGERRKFTFSDFIQYSIDFSCSIGSAVIAHDLISKFYT